MRWEGARVVDWLQWEASDRDAAWAALHEITAVVMRRVGSKYRLQSADREDVAADVVWLAVDEGCARLRDLDGAVSLPAWLWGVARNLSRGLVRRRRWESLSDQDVENFGFDEELASIGTDRRFDPALFLDALSPAQREVEAALLAGLSEREIARRLSISRNAVRDRVRRGRRRMRRRVAETFPPETR